MRILVSEGEQVLCNICNDEYLISTDTRKKKKSYNMQNLIKAPIQRVISVNNMHDIAIKSVKALEFSLSIVNKVKSIK